MLATNKKSPDKTLAAKVVDIGMRVAAASSKDYEWEVTLFDSKDVNAFCLPGGKMGVYSGIIPVAKNNAALAAVMGHEVAHAVAQHGAERVSQSLIVSGTLIAADVAMKDSKHRQSILAALGLGAQVGIMMPYGRTQESEADEIGLEYMARAGYDPREAVGLWERMAALGGSPPEILSTHPDPRNRAKALQELMPAAMKIYEKSVKIPTVNF
jgi:predicted Zn-dependent protease